MVSMIDFSQTADVVAPQLLGAYLQHGPVIVQLTEVEAYLGESDPASHAFKGPTPRCATMFGPPGHLYVYASYGIHRAGNLVCSPDGSAGGVLMRGARVIAGHSTVRARRGTKPVEAGLARGPGNLGSALGLDLHLNGSTISQREGSPDLSSAVYPDTVASSSPNPNAAAAAQSAEPQVSTHVEGSAFTLWPGESVTEYRVGPRIGITKNADAPLRFWIPRDPTVTSPRR